MIQSMPHRYPYIDSGAPSSTLNANLPEEHCCCKGVLMSDYVAGEGFRDGLLNTHTVRSAVHSNTMHIDQNSRIKVHRLAIEENEGLCAHPKRQQCIS